MESKSGSSRPPSNGDSTFVGLPLWSRVVAMVGIPGAIAFFLVYIGAMQVPRIAAALEGLHVEAAQIHVTLAAMQKEQEDTYRLLQRICSSIAKTDEERSRCFDH